MESKRMIYEELELISVSKPEIRPKWTINLSWSKLWNFLMTALAQKHELKVTQKKDASGNKWWRVDDPITHQKSEFASETEVMLWLEKRFYR
jgi:hypothetical protein